MAVSDDLHALARRHEACPDLPVPVVSYHCHLGAARLTLGAFATVESEVSRTVLSTDIGTVRVDVHVPSDFLTRDPCPDPELMSPAEVALAYAPDDPEAAGEYRHAVEQGDIEF